MRRSIVVSAIAIQWLAGQLALETMAGSRPSHLQTRGPESVVGEVIGIDKPAKIATVKLDQGDVLVVKAEGNTRCLRVPAGETTLEKASAIQFEEIGVGDRLLARGKISDDKKQMLAGRLIVLSKADVDRKRQHDLDEWRRRGLAGVIKELNPQTGDISIERHGPEGPALVTLSTSKCQFRRYAPGSIKFADAGPSSFAELKVGDQLRVLGDRSSDGKALKAEEIVSGSFKTLGAVVDEVDPQKSEIKATALDQKTHLVISVGKDSGLHRIPPEMAGAIAQKLLAGGPGGAAAPQRPPAANSTSDLAGGKATPPPSRADLQQMIDGLPLLTIADIKAGDVVAVTCTADRNDARIAAIKLVAGVDGVLNALKPAPGKRQTISLAAGLPAGFDFSAVQP